MSTYGTPLLRAINALDDPVLRELAGWVAVGKLLSENPSLIAVRKDIAKRVESTEDSYALATRAKGYTPSVLRRRLAIVRILKKIRFL